MLTSAASVFSPAVSSAASTAAPVPPDPEEEQREQALEDTARTAAHVFQRALGRLWTDYQALVRVLNQSSTMVQKIRKIYDAEGGWSGNGMWADVLKYCSSDYVELLGALFTRASVSVGQPQLMYVRDATFGHDQHWITAKPARRTVVPGTRVAYTVEMGPELTAADSGYSYQWYCLNDPDTSKRAGEDALVFGTTLGTWEVEGRFVGNHRLVCRVQFRTRQPGFFGGYDYGIPEYIEYQQTLSTAVDVLNDAMASAVVPQRSGPVAAHGERIPLHPPRGGAAARVAQAGRQGQGEGLDRQVEKLTDKLKSSEGKQRFPIRAVHLAAETATVSALNVFVAKISSGTDEETWTLVDITNPVDRRLTSEHTGTGKDAKEAILSALRAWESGNRYPKGQLRVQIPAATGAEIEREFHTDGATFWDAIADFFNQVGFWAGLVTIGSAVLLSIAPDPTVSKVAAVALWTSILAGTTGAVIGMVQRHAEHMSTFSEDAFDMVTIAANILGARWALGATVKGLALQGTRMGTAVVIGLITTDVAQGVLLSADFADEYQQILSDPDPKRRTDRLLTLLRTAMLTGGLLILSLKGNKEELAKLPGLKDKPLELGKLADRQQTIDVTEAEAQAKAHADAEAKAKADEAEARARADEAKAKANEEARARIDAEVAAKGHPGEAPEGWRRAVAQVQDVELGKLAAAVGASVAEYKTLVDDHLKDLFARSILYKRVEVEHLEKILTSGRFKSQFETNTSGGLNNTFYRNQVEANVFSFDGTKTRVEERPQYGYFSADPNGSHPGVRQYGDTTVRFKPEVRDRTTVTFGDSGDATRWGTFPSVSPKPANDPGLGAFDFIGGQHTHDPLEVKSLDEFWPYVEGQVDGGLDVNGIAEVIFDGAAPAQVTAQLDALHIPWRVKK